MRRITALTFASFGLLGSVFVGSAIAGPIVQDLSNLEDSFSDGRSFGQTFTAEEALLQSVTLYVSDSNPEFGDPFSINVQVFAGSGYGGALLGNWNSADLGADFSGGVSAAFNGLRLTPGAEYTIRVDSPNDRGVLQSNQNRFPDGVAINADYEGGHMINWDGAPLANYDLRFRVDFLETCDVVRNADGTLSALCGDDVLPISAEACSLTDNGDGSSTLSCPDGSSALVREGADGGSCRVEDAGNGKARITCPDGSSEVIGTESCDSTDGAPAPLGFGLALLAVLGFRRRR